MEIQRRYKVEIGQPERICITLVGCGGTGSFLALHLARLAFHAREQQGVRLQLQFVDPDVVETGNLGRQNFCPAELGLAKAHSLMERYNLAFGLGIEASVERFGVDHVNRHNPYRGFHLIVGAVDNAAARQELQAAVRNCNGKLWWLDCGNHEHAGQVLLGNRTDLTEPELSPLGFCTALPSPGNQHPELLEAPTVPAMVAESCAELVQADVQSLMINQAMAGWAAIYVARLVLSRDLDIYATYSDLVTGSARSLPILEGRES